MWSQSKLRCPFNITVGDTAADSKDNPYQGGNTSAYLAVTLQQVTIRGIGFDIEQNEMKHPSECHSVPIS